MRKKSIKRVLATLMLFFISVSQIYAYYYVSMEVKMSGTGGKIYLARQENSQVGDLTKYQTSTQSSGSIQTSSGGTITFDIGATPATRGYKFDSWVSKSKCTFVNGTSAADAQATVTVTASTKSYYSTKYLSDTQSGSITAKFVADPSQVNVSYLSASNGSYTAVGPSGYGTITIGDGSSYATYGGDAITLNATPATGYTFIRYYTVDADGNIATLGNPFQASQIVNITGFTGSVSVCAEFSQQPFAIGIRTYANLDAALQAVKTSSNKTIVAINNTTVTEGHYTIPSGVTLLVPRDKGQTEPMTVIERVDATSAATSAYRTLTLAAGVDIQVYGSIEVGGKQAAGAQGATGAGIPTGTYGHLVMNAGSKISLNSGAKLYAWGFVTGEGEIDARRGSQVYEQFQMYDWKGGTYASGMVGASQKVFPISQYFIQNVEVSTKYHPGAELISMTSMKISQFIFNCNTIKIIGGLNSGAMFLMDEADYSDNTWVKKSYNVSKDLQIYEVNSSASLGYMIVNFDLSWLSFAERLILTVAGIDPDNFNFDSRNFILPVTNNLKIHLLDGLMDIKQSTVMLPGAEIEIDKTATVDINSGQSLYLYDIDQFKPYIFSSNGYSSRIKHRPGTTPTEAQRSITDATKIGDASLNIHGTFDVKGYLYTTSSGANIYSSIQDAGTVQFTSSAPSTTSPIYQWHSTGSKTSEYITEQCTSAKLKNEVTTPSNSPTAGTASGKSFCYLFMGDVDPVTSDPLGKWVNLTTDGCFVYDNEGIYYAKPADYVALKNGKTENADHTYSSADDTRLFILFGDCQWWEVTYHEQSGLYYCDKNGIYYYYDDSDPRPEYQEWKEKRCVITWQDWDGTEILSYDLPYGATPEYLGSFPTRPDDVGYYTYDFTAWAPAFTPVTADVTYVAQYERNPVMYTITWQNANGTEREVDYFQRDEMPVCRTQPADMSALEWRPAVAAVTGNATYRLYPKDNVGPYDIKFVNWNGAQIGATQSVAKGSMPNVPADPTKPALDDVEFIFAGWSPEVVAATAAATYTATFTEQPITYTILWKNYDDATLETDENVALNAVPQYNGATPTKPSDETYNYAFSGWDSEIVAATEDAIYTAQFSATPKDKIIDTNETVEEGMQQTVTNLTITSTGQLTIPSTSRINAENLILEGTNTTSGQLISNLNTSINTVNAYFDWTPNGNAGTQYRTWYAVAVPWEVNAETGIFIKDGRHLVLGSDFDLVWYDGEERAANGDGFNCWKYVEYETDKIMHPGKSYMMYFGPTGIQTIRFAKASGSAVIYNSPINVETYDLGTGVTTDANWNGIANPRTYYVSLGTGASFAQVLGNGSLDAYFANPEAPVYTTIDVDASKFIVGQPIFVQAVNPQPVVVTKETSAGIVNAAPRRARTNNLPDDIAARYAVHIALDGHASTDNLFIQVTEEEKEDTYVLGQDLSKGGVAKTLPQLWVNRYNSKLSVNTQSLTNDVAEYPLTIFAPKAGEYVINTENAYDDYDLYLTRNGEAVWNLSNGEYTFSLPQGNTSEYGLRLSARKSPSVATGVDEAVVDAQGEIKKVIINDKVFIIRGENVYSVDGQLVK